MNQRGGGVVGLPEPVVLPEPDVPMESIEPLEFFLCFLVL